jgi:hypothetical protein
MGLQLWKESMINLPEVTLFAISSIFINETIASLLKSSEEIQFGSIKFLTHEKPRNLPEKIEYVEIPRINDVMDYNQLCFSGLGDFIDTSHGLLTQYHAWILNPTLFDKSWLQYDYIGAIWPLREGSFIANNGERVRNGNGGFSLRSKKLMSIPKMYNWPLRQDQGYFNEDGNLNCYYRKELLELGINYAPTEVAARFSFENYVEENMLVRTFGFHRSLPYWESVK